MVDFAVCKRTLVSKDKKYVFKLIPGTRSLVAYEGSQDGSFDEDVAVKRYTDKRFIHKGGMEVEVYSVPKGNFDLEVPTSEGRITVTVNMDEATCRSLLLLLMGHPGTTTTVEQENRQILSLEDLGDIVSEATNDCSVVTGDAAAELNKKSGLSSFGIRFVTEEEKSQIKLKKRL